MLKFFNSRFRHLTQPFRINTPFKHGAFISLFSQIHGPGECSKIASLLSGLELDDEEEEDKRKEEFRSSSTTSFHGREIAAKLERDAGESSDGQGVLSPSRQEGAFQIVHPWPEWADLMELLLKRGYFDEVGNEEMGFDAKDSNLVRTACLNFGRDRIDIIRHISRKDIRVIVGFGCPSLDRKVVNSGKRLRAYVGIDEGNICSSCSLRGNCDRAHVKPREVEVARTVDLMRILLTLGLDHTTSSVENAQCQNESVMESARSLLRDVVGFYQEELDSAISPERDLRLQETLRTQRDGHMKVPMKQGDWICPKCNFMNFARNIKCLRCNGLCEDRVRRIIEDQYQLPLKKGDWLCEKCNFLNFAKNSKCKLCQEKPPKRKLDHGEWECDSCHYINFRKNTLCLRCDHRRPKASTASNPLPELNDNQDEAMSCAETREDERRQQNSWEFVVDENCTSKKRVLEYMDFPILGGKSSLSQSEEEREKWRARMRKTNNCMTNAAGEKGNGSGFAEMRRPEFLECSDEGEMEEWFGQVKE
ncbi:hypothetical protein V2J09_020561 [Rumex salicifolius]